MFHQCILIIKKDISVLGQGATRRLDEKDSKIKSYSLSLGNISKDFAVNNVLKIGLNGCVYNFSVDYNTFDISSIIKINKYLMKKHDI